MLKKHIIQYTIGILSVSIVFILSGILSTKFFNYLNCSKNYLSLIFLFLPTSIIFHFILVFTVEKNPKKFVPTFLILTILKILIYLIVLVIFIFKITLGIKCFLVLFLLFYLGFTLYEVIMLSIFLKNSKTR
jgi:hypothetical protein